MENSGVFLFIFDSSVVKISIKLKRNQFNHLLENKFSPDNIKEFYKRFSNYSFSAYLKGNQE